MAKSVDLVARGDSNGRDVLCGLNERDIEQRRQPATRLDLGAGPVGVVGADVPKPRANCKSLRRLIELYGRDRDRVRAEVEIMERQLKHRLALFPKPDDAAIRKVVCKNARRALAVYLHVRSGHRGRPETKCSVAIILISE